MGLNCSTNFYRPPSSRPSSCLLELAVYSATEPCDLGARRASSPSRARSRSPKLCRPLRARRMGHCGPAKWSFRASISQTTAVRSVCSRHGRSAAFRGAGLSSFRQALYPTYPRAPAELEPPRYVELSLISHRWPRGCWRLSPGFQPAPHPPRRICSCRSCRLSRCDLFSAITTSCSARRRTCSRRAARSP